MIEDMDNESQDIFQTSLIDRYAARPDSLNNLCLAEFATNYSTQSGRELPDGETSDAVTHLRMVTAGSVNAYNSKTALDTCTSEREAIIPFHRFNYEKEASKVYRSKLMLYLL